MAQQVQNIITEANAIAASYLGANWKSLRYVLEIAKNDIRSGYQAYGVRPLEASSVSGPIGFYSLDHRFELVLCSTYARHDSDSEIYTVLYDLYDKADEIYQLFEGTKLNLVGTVLLLSEPSVSEPEVLAEQGLVALRNQFTVRYRSTVP